MSLQLKCTCSKNTIKQENYFEDQSLVEKLRERQLELEELNLEIQHNIGNLVRENQMLKEKLKVENQELNECVSFKSQVSEDMRNYKLSTFKKYQDLQLLIQTVHELEADKKMKSNEVEYLRQSLLHSNETQEQLFKKDEHIKLLQDRIYNYEMKITEIKKQIISKYRHLQLVQKEQNY